MSATRSELDYLLGQDVAARVVGGLGGVCMVVPRTPTALMLERIALDDARALCAALSGEHISIPAGARQDRHAEIRADRAQGMTGREIAIKHRITQRHVWRILAGDQA